MTTGWKQYFTFQGRIARRQFWIVLGVLFLIGALLELANTLWDGSPLLLLLLPLMIAYWIASLSNSIRRLHDLGYSGWWLLALIGAVIAAGAILVFTAGPGAASYGPAVLSIVFLIWLGATPGQPQTNRFGPPPGAVQAAPAEDQLEGEEIHYSGED